MAYKDKEQQRAYQREFCAKRRRDWLAANGPCRKCGSFEQLEVDHVDPETKVHHNVWSWSKARREAELAKCQVLCRQCHQRKTAEQNPRPAQHGTHSKQSKGCNCSPCRAAHAKWSRDRRALRGAA